MEQPKYTTLYKRVRSKWHITHYVCVVCGKEINAKRNHLKHQNECSGIKINKIGPRLKGERNAK
jgi:hypothetical protein